MTRYSFADCSLDTGTHSLIRDGSETHVEPQVFDLLALLAAEAPALVSYDRLIEEVWQGRIVSDATLAARISAARAAVGDDGRRQAVIRTHPRRGVQLIVPVNTGEGPAPAAPGPADRQVIRYARSRDGTALAWAEVGEGPPLLRAGHWMSHLEHDWKSPVWRPLLDRLANGRRLVRFDPRGTGLSDRVLGNGGLEAFVDDLETVADAAGLDRFPIYAISQSVPIAIAFAVRHPERVSRMILNNGLIQGEFVRGEAEKTEALIAMIRTGWGVPGSPFMKAIATIFMPQSTPEELDSLVETQLVSATPDTAAELRRQIAGIDVSDRLGDIRCPVRIMHCEHDAVQPPEQSRRMAAMIPNAEISLLPSANHVVAPSDPIWAGCVDEFDRFLAEEV